MRRCLLEKSLLLCRQAMRRGENGGVRPRRVLTGREEFLRGREPLPCRICGCRTSLVCGGCSWIVGGDDRQQRFTRFPRRCRPVRGKTIRAPSAISLRQRTDPRRQEGI